MANSKIYATAFISAFLNPLLLCVGVLVVLPTSLNAQCCRTTNLLAAYNPDFSASFSSVPPGFRNDNSYSGSITAGYYIIITDRNWGACSSTPQYDHTAGNSSGKYLWFDTRGTASASNPAVAWEPYNPTKPTAQQNRIAVNPNTNYVLSVWVRDLARSTNCTTGGAPVVGLRINGTDMAQIDLGNFTSPCCPEWKELCVQWNSGSNTSVLLQIESRSGTGFTDLGIDDVYFGEAGGTLTQVPGLLGNDTLICKGESVNINLNIPGASYQWSSGATTSGNVITSAGTHWVKVFQNGCASIDSIKVAYITTTPLNLGKDTVLCDGQQFTLNVARPNATYFWQNGSAAATQTITTPGTYWVRITEKGCTYFDSLDVKSVSNYFSLGNDTLVCEGEELVYSFPISGATYLWSTGSTASSLSVTTPGTYWLKASIGGCLAIDTVEVSMEIPLPLELGNDTSYCQGGELTLDVSRPGSSYLWHDGSTSPVYDVVQAGLHWVAVDQGVCHYGDSIQIQIIDTTTMHYKGLIKDTVKCQGDEIALGFIKDPKHVKWNTGDTAKRIMVNEFGTYWAYQYDGCKSRTDTVLVRLYEKHKRLRLPPDSQICIGELLPLPAKIGDFRINWSMSNVSPGQPITESGLMNIDIRDLCYDYHYSMEMQPIECSCTIFLPNTFTPGTDNINPVFSAVTYCEPDKFDIRIFNRWGELIYFSERKDFIWDGTNKGKPCPEAYYIYKLNYTYTLRHEQYTETLTGGVHLIRR